MGGQAGMGGQAVFASADLQHLHRELPMLVHAHSAGKEAAFTSSKERHYVVHDNTGKDDTDNDQVHASRNAFGASNLASSQNHHVWKVEWDRLDLHNPYAFSTLDYAKDVASCVERCRILAKSTQCHVIGVPNFPLSTTVVEEHRELVMTADVWQILATDVGLQSFTSSQEKVGYAAGIVDELPALLHIYNDAILVKHQVALPTRSLQTTWRPSPSQVSGGGGAVARDELDGGESSREETGTLSMLFLLGATVRGVACAMSPAQKGSHRPTSTGIPAQCKKVTRKTGVGDVGQGQSYLHALKACARRRRLGKRVRDNYRDWVPERCLGLTNKVFIEQ
jgi:hypothetical protein